MYKYLLIIFFLFPFILNAGIEFDGDTRWGYQQFVSDRYTDNFGSTGVRINSNAEIELGIFNNDLILRQSNRPNRDEIWSLNPSENDQISISNRGNQADLKNVFSDTGSTDNSDLISVVKFWGQVIFCSIIFQWGLTIAVIVAIKFNLN